MKSRKQTTENKRKRKIQAVHSCIRGTSCGKRAAHCTLQKFLNSTQCKILEWQVMNEKMNSMWNVQKQHLSFNSRKGPSECF